MDLALSRALEAVHRIRDESPPWRDILDTARALIGGDSATFLMFEERQLVAAEHVDIADAALRDYLQHFHAHDIMLPTGPAQRAGRWLDTEQVLARGDFRTNPYYTDFMCPHRMRQMLTFVVEETATRNLGITVQRSEARGDAGARLRSEPVVRYGQALQAAFRARADRAAQVLAGAASAFDDFGAAGCLVSGRGGLAWASPAARALLERSALRVRSGRWWHPDDRVRAALAAGIMRAQLGAGAAPVRVVVPQAGAQGCLVLEMVRADPRMRFAGETLVFVRMQLRMPADRVPVDALQAAFGLSVAEARVLAALAAGETIAGHARAHGVSVHTVRKQIANLGAKMGCARQVDLVRRAIAVL